MYDEPKLSLENFPSLMSEVVGFVSPRHGGQVVSRIVIFKLSQQRSTVYLDKLPVHSMF